MKAYFLLTMSIIFEVFATTMLKISDGFTLLLPSTAVIFGYTLSFIFLGLTLKALPLSLAYAIWAGVGTVLTLLVSVVLWGEVLSIVKVTGIVLIIGGVILLNATPDDKSAAQP